MTTAARVTRVTGEHGDNDAEWRAELVKRYESVTSFLGLLARLELGAVDSRRALWRQ